MPREHGPSKAERDSKPDEQQEIFGKKEAFWVPDLHRTLSHLRSHTLGPSHGLSTLQQSVAPFREPLQFSVITVMSVMSGTFPDTYGVFYMTVNRWRVRGPSRHRHGERHQENPIGKRPSSYHDGDDAELQRFSKWGDTLL